MQSAAAMEASKKDQWNPADRRTLIVMPDVKGIGNVLIVEPIKGRLKSNTAWSIIVMRTRLIIKKRNVNNGFLYPKSSNGFEKDLVGITEYIIIAMPLKSKVSKATTLSANISGTVNDLPRNPKFAFTGEAFIVIKLSPTVSCHQG
jgi:hypothetical protein